MCQYVLMRYVGEVNNTFFFMINGRDIYLCVPLKDNNKTIIRGEFYLELT